jgi:carbon-monoxide dehydrogenase small subunit
MLVVLVVMLVRTVLAVLAVLAALSVTVNGTKVRAEVEDRTSLADCLRHGQRLTGTHLGCEHGVCGACTVLVDGRTARSCLMLAAQAEGREVCTVESLGTPESLHPLQQAFWDHHGLQCGFCTSGILMTLVELLRENPSPDEATVRAALSGNLCRCTGYQNIVAAALDAAAQLRALEKTA